MLHGCQAPGCLPDRATRGGGYRAGPRRGVHPQTTRANKKGIPIPKKSRKNKKGENEFYKSALRAHVDIEEIT